jgi:polyisoprenoid-binding protein YceI
VEAVIPTASIATNNETRDKDLRSDNFFDVAKYPAMAFKSTAVTGTPAKAACRWKPYPWGVTKSVTFEIKGAITPAKIF